MKVTMLASPPLSVAGGHPHRAALANLMVVTILAFLIQICKNWKSWQSTLYKLSRLTDSVSYHHCLPSSRTASSPVSPSRNLDWKANIGELMSTSWPSIGLEKQFPCKNQIEKMCLVLVDNFSEQPVEVWVLWIWFLSNANVFTWGPRLRTPWDCWQYRCWA